MNLNLNLDFSREECCVCAIIFFVPQGFYSNRKETKASFYCPNGHSQSYKKSRSEELMDDIHDKDLKMNRILLENKNLTIEVGKLNRKYRKFKK